MKDSSIDRGALHAQLLELPCEFRQFGKTASGGLTRLAAVSKKNRRENIYALG